MKLPRNSCSVIRWTAFVSLAIFIIYWWKSGQVFVATQHDPDHSLDLLDRMDSVGEKYVRDELSASRSADFISSDVTEDRIERLEVKLPALLPNFKNPCWYESYPNVSSYERSWYGHFGKHTCSSSGFLEKYFRQTAQRMRLDDLRVKKKLRCFPYFFVLGVAKCGTTDLYVALLRHHQIAKPLLKEPKYWSRVRFGAPYQTKTCHRKSVPRATFSDYLDVFDQAAGKMKKSSKINKHFTITGDFSPGTLYGLSNWDHIVGNSGLNQPNYTTADHIYQFLPSAKFIIIMRNPVERAYSLYRFRFNDDPDVAVSPEDFHRRIIDGTAALKSCITNNNDCVRCCLYQKEPYYMNSSLIIPGFYATYITDWLRKFDRKQFLLLKTEDYHLDRMAQLAKVARFLGLSPWSNDEMRRIQRQRKYQRSEKSREMLNETRDLLQSVFFNEWNRHLADIDGTDKFLWQHG